MAKARTGLGRGLNSLLSGSMGETTSQERQQTNRITVNLEDKPEEKVEQQPAPVAEPPLVEEDAPATQVDNEIEEDIEELLEDISEDNVVIKSVVARQAIATPIPEVIPAKEAALETLKDTAEVDIDKIAPNPNQPRTNFKKEELEELAESIKKNGLLQPILVRNMPDGTYQIIAGERRWQACKQLKMEKVPVRIRDVDDDETIILGLVENIQRSDLNPIEEAYGYRRMMERGKMTQSEVAQAVSKGRSTIANALRLLELPEDAQQLLYEERITAGHARAILSIPTQEGRRKLTDKLVESQLSVRETEAIARLLAGKKEKKAPAERPQAPKSYRTVARALSDALAAEVKIKSSKGKNKIEISFKDEADLERLFRKIASNS